MLKKLSFLALIASPVLAQASTLAEQVQQQIQDRPYLISTAKNWQQMVQGAFGTSKVTASDLAYLTQAYFSVINRNYQITPTSYQSADVDAFVKLAHSCQAYLEQEGTSAPYATDCQALLEVYAGAAYKADVAQSLGLLGLREDLSELQAPTASQQSQLQALLNPENLQKSFKFYQVTYEDYEQHKLPAYFAQNYKIYLVPDHEFGK